MIARVKLLTITAIAALLVITGVAGPAHATGYDWEPEYLYYIEDTGAYFLPDPGADLFLHLGKWYRRSEGSWSVSASLSGPWGGILISSVPEVLVRLPADFRITRRLGLIPYRYVVKPRKRHEGYGYRYYRGDYYRDHDRRGYRRHWHPHGRFWFFVAPDFDDNWDDSHRRRRGRGRGGRR